MTEIKKEANVNNLTQVAEEDRILEVSWQSLKLDLKKLLEPQRLVLSDGDNEKLLRGFFVLRRKKHLGDITFEDYFKKVNELFKDKDEQIFGVPDDPSRPGDPVMKASIEFITSRTKNPNF